MKYNLLSRAVLALIRLNTRLNEIVKSRPYESEMLEPSLILALISYPSLPYISHHGYGVRYLLQSLIDLR